jgi:hypothetical protein
VTHLGCHELLYRELTEPDIAPAESRQDMGCRNCALSGMDNRPDRATARSGPAGATDLPELLAIGLNQISCARYVLPRQSCRYIVFEGVQAPMMISVSPFFGCVLGLIIPGAPIIMLVAAGDDRPPLPAVVDCR